MRSSFYFSVLAVGLLTGSLACGPAKRCTPTNCSGCCDATDQCQAGTSPLACGSVGAMCVACPNGATCTAGVCGGTGTGGGTGGGGGGGSITIAQICHEVITAQYGLYARCGLYSTAGAMQMAAAQEAECLRNDSSGLSSGKVVVDPAVYANCLAAFNGTSCTPSSYENACNNVFVGQVARGAECQFDQQCVPGDFCDPSLQCPGKCAARIAVGSPAPSGSGCVIGASVYGGTCAANVAIGQSCAATGGSTDPHNCVDGAVCTQAEVCAAYVYHRAGESCDNRVTLCEMGKDCVGGTCVAYGAPGAACDSMRTCQADSLCSNSNVCVAMGFAGAACMMTGDCNSTFFCNKQPGSNAGVCTARRSVGQSCTNSGFECQYDLFCTAPTGGTGVCKLPQGTGGACHYGDDYRACDDTHYCNATMAMPDGQCTPSGAVGAACAFGRPDRQCEKGMYCTASALSPTGVCANKKRTGARCGGYEECLSYSCSSGQCTGSYGCF